MREQQAEEEEETAESAPWVSAGKIVICVGVRVFFPQRFPRRKRAVSCLLGPSPSSSRPPSSLSCGSLHSSFWYAPHKPCPLIPLAYIRVCTHRLYMRSAVGGATCGCPRRPPLLLRSNRLRAGSLPSSVAALLPPSPLTHPWRIPHPLVNNKGRRGSLPTMVRASERGREFGRTPRCPVRAC